MIDARCCLCDALLFITNAILQLPKTDSSRSSSRSAKDYTTFLFRVERSRGRSPLAAFFCFLFLHFLFWMSATVVHLPSVWVLVPGHFTAGIPPSFDVSRGRRIYGHYEHADPGKQPPAPFLVFSVGSGIFLSQKNDERPFGLVLIAVHHPSKWLKYICISATSKTRLWLGKTAKIIIVVHIFTEEAPPKIKKNSRLQSAHCTHLTRARFPPPVACRTVISYEKPRTHIGTGLLLHAATCVRLGCWRCRISVSVCAPTRTLHAQILWKCSK